MKTKRWMFPLLGMFLVAFISCEKGNDDIGKPTVQLAFETVTSGSALKSTATNNLEFTSGNIILESIEFETDSEADSLEVDFEIDSYITLDFATGETDPDVSSVEITPGTFTEIEIELWDQTDEPAIVLDGTWTDADGNIHPVRFEFSSGQTFEVEKEGEFIIEQSTAMIAEITFDPNVWFSGVTAEKLSSATTDDEGVIVISSGQNTDIYDIVEDKIDVVSEVEISM
jgi:hypothetical protein